MSQEDEALGAERAAADDRSRLALRLHALAYLATGDSGQARDLLAAVCDSPEELSAAAAPPDAVLATLVRVLVDRLGRHASRSLNVLEDTIRSEATSPIDLAAPPIDGVEERIPVLLGELRRRCLGWVLLTVPPLRRIAWILVEVLGVPTDAAAEMLNTTSVGLDVLLRRARAALTDYLEPRCGHLARPGYCTCESRLGVAQAAQFVGFAAEPSSPPPKLGPFTSIVELYRSLPPETGS